MIENIRLAFQGIWSHKLRSVLTMLGIIIGIAAIIIIVSTIKGTNEQIKENLIGSGNNVVTHEFNNQENIDVIFCGASHVSHGIYPKLADEKFNLNTFCTGTPSQGIDGTYAI